MVKKALIDSKPKLYSMTGYGSARKSFGTIEIQVELRSVNSRFLDLILKLPNFYYPFENGARAILQEHIKRGRVEVLVQRTSSGAETNQQVVKTNTIEALWKLYQEQAEAKGCWDSDFKKSSLLQILNRRDVFELEEGLVENFDEQSAFCEVLKLALNDMLQMRINEGIKLLADIKNHLDQLKQAISQIKVDKEEIRNKIKARLFERLQPLLADSALEPARLNAEAAVLADRADISEELLRFESHILQFEENLESNTPGKKLEFILQELGREVNTISAKVQNFQAQNQVVNAKTCIERIKEQCANIE